MSEILSEIAFDSDNNLLLKGPKSQVDPSALVVLEAAIVTGRLFNANQRSQVATDAAPDSDKVVVEDVSGFTNGLAIAARTDDRGWHVTTVASTNPTTKEITLSLATSGGRFIPAGKWSYIQQQFGGDIPMALYGTPALENSIWGYRGPIADDLVGIDLEFDVRAEVEFDGGPGLRLYRVKRRIRVVEALD